MGKQWKQWQTLFSWGSKITADGNCSHAIKRCLLLGKKSYDKPIQCIKKERHHFADNGPQSQSYGFPIVMHSCQSWTIKRGEHQTRDVFELWCWRRVLRVPWTTRRSNQSILKEFNPEYLLEGLVLNLKLQHFGHLMTTADPWKRPWC